MQALLHIIRLISVVLFSASIAIAQIGQSTKPNTKQDSKITLTYNEAWGSTTIHLEPILLSGTDINKLELEVFSSFRGKIPTEKPTSGLWLLIIAGSKKEWFGSNTELTFILDGERMPLGSMRRGHRSCKKSLPGGTGCVYWIEKMDLFIPYQSFSPIIKAKKVEGQIGTRTFALKESELEVLRDFNKRLTPQGVQEF